MQKLQNHYRQFYQPLLQMLFQQLPSVAVHVTTPSLLDFSNPVTTVSPTFTNPSFLKGLPIVADESESSTEAAPEDKNI